MGMEWFLPSSSWLPFRKRAKGGSWRGLLESTGPDLWLIRKQVLLGKSEEEESSSVVVLPLSKSGQGGRVAVVCSALKFQQLEAKHNLDKFQNTDGCSLPLTQCTGDGWARQRLLVTTAFQSANILTRSLEAAEEISFSQEGSNNENDVIRVDLREIIVRRSLGWVVRLFAGRDDSELERKCFEYWTRIRTKKTNMKANSRAREAFVSALKFDGGLLLEFAKSDLSSGEVTANAVNAIIAALDAVQSLVFWTIWNMSRTDEVWERCRNEISTDDSTMQDEDVRMLADLKKRATQGEQLDWVGLSCLGKALAETVRAYPPIWTLPRTCYHRGTMSTKVDVPTVNGALSCDWNPDREGVTTLASFGLGKRSCPGGTAALVAAYKMIRCFVSTFRSAKECNNDRAIHSAYLGPTLCVSGPQLFELTASSF